MNSSETVGYYTDLLRTTTFGEALAWTVVRPLGETSTLEATAARLIGDGHPFLMESNEEIIEEAEFVTGHAVFMGRSGDSITLLEPGGFGYCSTPQVMAWLSQDALVWHLSWNHTGSRVLEFAAGSQRLARMPRLDHQALHGADPTALREEAAALEQLGEAAWPLQEATLMAIIEQRTGARLSADWSDQHHQVAIVDPLIDKACPPIGFRHHDPDVHAELMSVSQGRRQAVLLHVIDLLVQRFDLGQSAAAHALRTVRQGQPLNDALLEEVQEEWVDLGARWAERGYAVREEDENAWRRWVAANGIRHSLRSLSEGASFLDGLTYARFALPEEWPEIRAWISNADD
ncbi:hypothetical protein ABZ897_09520 [Nonomuraea sp. NPDC046802]|uniref:hypothetical protein n=1 Tax=Nonomuraea sp. NPDC046802 TaxID=3154919 RepID=UPI00340053D7